MNYPPLVWQIALYLKSIYKVPFNKVLFDKASDYIEDFNKATIKFLHTRILDKYLIKELLFQGFVPLDTYRTRDRYAYIMTNRQLESSYYIYPMRLADNYDNMKKGKYLNYQDLFGKIGIPGIIRIKYSNDGK